jgi:hypothetical protein
MSRDTIRIALEDAREISGFLDSFVLHGRRVGAALRLKRALARFDRYNSKPRPKRQKPALPYPKMVGQREKALRASKSVRRDRRAGIRAEVFRRAGESNDINDPTDYYRRCEGPRGHDPTLGGRCLVEATDLSHLFGKGKGRLPESVRTCAAWCRDCHKAFGASRPTAKAWWTFIATWLRSQGFLAEAAEAEKRAAFVEVRRSLPAAPRLDSRTRTE